jgi:hypothetical protein
VEEEMATRRQAEQELRKLGFQLDPAVSGKSPDGMGHAATFDPVGRMSLNGECRGTVIYDYTESASAFWDEVIEEARKASKFLTPCPEDPGCCEFHDADEDLSA